jgi:hypothetical protein
VISFLQTRRGLYDPGFLRIFCRRPFSLFFAVVDNFAEKIYENAVLLIRSLPEEKTSFLALRKSDTAKTNKKRQGGDSE